MNVLEIKNLKILFRVGDDFVRAVEGVDIHVGEGERVAIVGESGCGKSVTGLACMKLHTTPPAYTTTPESCAALYSIPVPTTGASGLRRGTA